MADIPHATNRDYDRVARAIDFIIAGHAGQPSLDDVAAHVGLSPFHLQRLFKRWAGVSPKQFAGYLTVEYAKTVLEKSASLLSTSLDAGLSGASRLHDAFVAVEAMTPGDYKAQGRDLIIRYGIHDTPFGRALVLVTARGICGLEFIVDGNEAAALTIARARWPLSQFVADLNCTGAIAAKLGAPGAMSQERLLLRGTNFQIQVWSALLRVPAGAIVTYGDIAKAVCTSKATRAVGTALGQNTLGYLVPCHRVLRATGLFKAYRWGATRRRAMIAWEAARSAS
ncbi:MAG: methylated-DNA--[protein]-cysteine S-methyltransferase [Rhodospirillaceae bacterium]|nr:MAG: methylated-DNA--[protein]-cysteine S-methyltransferase [Rhodospirillaceae bacterium]